MQQAYLAFHQAGYAHSVETWVNGELVGGLYCVALGKAVFGESMFSKRSDASKIALAALTCFCRANAKNESSTDPGCGPWHTQLVVRGRFLQPQESPPNDKTVENDKMKPSFNTQFEENQTLRNFVY